jgi:flagellar secretion chaperone FliS
MFETDCYLEAQVMTAPPHRLHLMVVDGALRFARQAEQALTAKNYEAAHEALNTSRDFVSELIGGLHPERAPEMVEQLKLLFAYVYRCFVSADLHHDSRPVRDGIHILEQHRQTWLELIGRIQGVNTEAREAAPAADSLMPMSKPHLDVELPQRSWTA